MRHDNANAGFADLDPCVSGKEASVPQFGASIPACAALEYTTPINSKPKAPSFSPKCSVPYWDSTGLQ
ncbi:hypothetical protein V502_06323 [Pseudogymnoascus sp. VKM F-4520 (FW-2644)]|nr:hypothetical protein V502_06323 [Pseudogymnoascus sp. VKM F-4520 (FW-2644)]